MFSISSISGSISPVQSNLNNGFGQSLSALQSALQSGNLSTAQTAFSSLLNFFPGTSDSTASTASSKASTAGNAVSTDLQSLQSAIQSGNIGAAQSALTKLTTSLQGSKWHGYQHRHHRGGGLQNDLTGSSLPPVSSTSDSSSSTTNSTADLLNAIPTPGSDGSIVNYLA